jgi:spore coat protein U-like protein
MTRQRLRRILRMCVGVGWLTVVTLGHAALCTVGTTSVAFGAYDSFSNSPTESTGTVTVSCDAAAPYSVAINAGGTGSFNRAMSFGANQLAYNLYADSARTVVWGDGTGATSRVNHAGTGAVDIVYGRVPARQNVRAGSYGDSLIVTVEF